MANQAIALQARAPQSSGLGNVIQQNAQLINQMAQQRVAERQAAQAQQAMKIQAAQEARAAELHVPAMQKAQSEALTAQQSAALHFYDLVAEGVKHSANPQQVGVVADYLKKTFPGAAEIIDQTVSTMPQDPEQFGQWRNKTLVMALDAKDQLARDFTKQDTATGSRMLSIPKYGDGAATVVPGSEVNLGQEVTYVKGPNGEVIAAPKRLLGGGAGLVGGDRGNVRMGGVVPGTAGGKAGAAAGAGAAAKPVKSTESERRFGTIARNMSSNLSEMTNVLKTNPDVVRPSGVEYAASQIPFYGSEARLFAQSEPRQQFEAAALRFLDNVTYVNTGAGTSKTQEENYRRSYIPSYQDTPASAYRKLSNMFTFAENAKDAAGSLWTPAMDAQLAALRKSIDKLKPGAGNNSAPAATGNNKRPPLSSFKG